MKWSIEFNLNEQNADLKANKITCHLDEEVPTTMHFVDDLTVDCKIDR